MTLGDAVKARLLDITPLAALVGTRVFELVLPQNEKRKSIRLQVIGMPLPRHARGHVNQFAQRCMVDSYVPIDGTPDPIASVREMGAAVIGDGNGPNATGFAGWVGVISASPDTPIHILNVEVLNDGDEIFEEDAIKRIRLRQEYRVHWRELTVTVSP